MVARPLAIPVTRPALVTVATAGASDKNPDAMARVCPSERDSVPVACAVWPMRTGFGTVTATAVVVVLGTADDGAADDGAAGDLSFPQAARRANERAMNSRFITTPFADGHGFPPGKALMALPITDQCENP